MAKVIYLVGEKFAEFFSNNGVMSVNEFISLHQKSSRFPGVTYRIGQGVTSEEICKIGEILSRDATTVTLPARENKAFVHKKEEQNVVITKPLLCDQNKYRAFLMLDSRCAEMSDHITGQHIQGMVIIEAARQMMLSVTENYLAPKEQQGKIWIILNEMSVKFFSFLFPIEVQIEYLTEESENKENKSKYIASVNFYQNGKLAATIKITFSVYENEKLSQNEKKLAKKALEMIGETV